MDDINYNVQKTYTEEEVFQLFQRFRNEEKLASSKDRDERPLPVEITNTLEENSRHQLQETFKRYKKDLSRYSNDDWTRAEEINKSLLPKIKQHTVETTQLVSSIYKGSDITRTLGRGATEIFEQLQILGEGEISSEEAQTVLEEAIESARRLAVFAWAQSKQQDEEARDFALKALKLPASLKHLETKESGKKEAFSMDFIEQYNEARYQQAIIRSATSNQNGYGRGGFNNQHRGGKGFFRGGKNFFGGRGRGNPTFQQSSHYNQQQHHHQQQPRGDTDKTQ